MDNPTAASPQRPAIAIVGHVPPPYGGISVHIGRLVDRLARAGFNYRLYDTRRHSDDKLHIVPGQKNVAWFAKFLLTTPEQVIHIHSNRVSAILMASWFTRLRGRKLIVSMHSEQAMRWYRKRPDSPGRKLLRRAILRVAHVICVNVNISNWLGELGVPAECRSVIPAYLPPSESEKDPALLSDEFRQFLAQHEPVIATHGWFGYFINGVHVYSFDQVIELIQRLSKRYPKIGFYTLISGTYEDWHREEVFRKRKELGLEDRWLIADGVSFAVALYARSDLFLRPTMTDGDSVTVRECISMGIPVIASDSVPRPEGCVLYPNRDLEAMAKAVTDVLENSAEHRKRLSRTPSPDYSQAMMDVYRRVCAECADA